MAKGSTVRGTPIRHITSTGREGIAPGTPGGMSGTSDSLYASNTRGVSQVGRGTPYRSEAGNGPETRRVVSSDRYGMVESNGQGNANNPSSNGDGVILDRMARDYVDPAPRQTEDSPVPRHAARFDTADVVAENRAHLGHGSGPTAPNEAMARDELLNIGGVMSRGMIGTSHASNTNENELTDDDTLPSVPPASGR